MSWVHWLLLRLPPELAHDIGLWLLQLWQKVGCPFYPRPVSSPAVIHPSLPRLKFVSRVGLAAGFDKNGLVMEAMRVFGFGFVEVGTVTPLPQSGNAKPRLWRLPPDALVNHFGFNSDGIPAIRARVAAFRQQTFGFPLFVNIGKNRQTANENALLDYALGIEAFAGLCDGFVINLSSPNTPGLVDLQGKSFLEGLARHLPPGLSVLIKISSDLETDRYREVVSAVAAEKRFSGLVVSNTSRRMAEARAFENGGLSGAPLFHQALAAVHEAKKVLRSDQVLIGVGGIDDRAKAEQMREAGADLVEIYTGFVYRGPQLVRELSTL